jgi:mycofactocin precursor
MTVSTAAVPTEEAPAPDDAVGVDDVALIEEDLLVEDVSIDGMCGVY